MMPSDRRMNKALRHVLYEIEMLVFTKNALQAPQNQYAKNVLLESFVIHARNLFNFFYPMSDRRKDDMIVWDFIESRQYFRNNRFPKKDLKFILKKSNKQVAHLTYTRLNYNKRTKPWSYVKIFEGLTETISVFTSMLPDEIRIWFTNAQSKNF